jgi:acyl carrier protein
MDQKDLILEVQETMRRLFKSPNLVIDETMSAADIARWNSLNHVILISELEKKYHIKFSLTDMLEIRTIQDICDKIQLLSGRKNAG